MEQQVASALELSVKRTAGLNRGRDKDPAGGVLVVFQTRREHDEVRRHARNLEKKGRGL